MRTLQEMLGRPPGKRMRRRAFYVCGPNGRAFPMELDEGLCCVVFGDPRRGRRWIEETLPEPYRSQCRLAPLTTLEQVRALVEREKNRVPLVVLNPEPGARGPGSYDRLEYTLEIARSEAGVN